MGALRSCTFLACLGVLAACSPSAGDGRTGTPSATVQPPALARIRDWPLPASRGATAPDLVATPGRRLLLSWLEPADGAGHRLRLAEATPGQAWDAPVTVAEGDDWFVNWADTPHAYRLADGSLWAHWLRSTGPSRMDYGIAMARSGDGGASWSAPRLLHPPTRGDHGFVSFWQQPDGRLGVAWLDSRQKAAIAAGHGGHEDEDGHHGGGAAMMLRAALVGTDGATVAEWALDTSTCDCCTTSSALTGRGVVVVYRGRGNGEVRDTRIVRLEGGRWSAPRDVHADGWHFAGCPVNGPAVVAEGDEVWVAWYTEAGGEPELRAARSRDAGDWFGAPVTLARGPQVQGRVALALADGHLLAAWLEDAAPDAQRLVLGRYDLDWGRAQHTEVARIAARGRASGLPRLRWADGAAWLAWTAAEAADTPGGKPVAVLRGARVDWPGPAVTP